MSEACVTKFKSACITKAVKFGILHHLRTDNFSQIFYVTKITQKILFMIITRMHVLTELARR